MLKEAARLRARAAECHELARLTSYRPDRDLMLERARAYEHAAEQLERQAAQPAC
ncbi:hypothetical protein [Falsiroseomonas sp. CW058]|uniref:hypothetical protein n=1 Tax=Falsiroseomonas sp. CW058 TaxID=3388664 RepID=UPI003D322E72